MGSILNKEESKDKMEQESFVVINSNPVNNTQNSGNNSSISTNKQTA